MRHVKKSKRSIHDGLEALAFDGLYTAMLGAMSPALMMKVAKGKYRTGWGNKLGFVPKRDKNPRAWIHAVSVGEVMVADVLAQEIKSANPKLDIVTSTTTPTGQKIAREKFGTDKTFYLPIDFSNLVTRGMSRTKPNALILIELELWPNLISQANRRGAPVAIINGRISDRAFPKYKRIRSLVAPTMRKISLFACQSEVYAERFIELGAPKDRVFVTGSIKYDGVQTEFNEEHQAWARELLSIDISKNEKLLLGNSTHPTEELLIAKAWRELNDKTWRCCIVPRHPERGPEIEAELKREGFNVVRRSQFKDTPPVVDASTIVLVDTVGELGKITHAADLVVVGGSFIPHGGQSPIDAAALGLPIIYGPHMFNFTDTTELLRSVGGAIELTDAFELAPTVSSLCCDKSKQQELGINGKQAMLSAQGATKQTVKLLKEILP